MSKTKQLVVCGLGLVLAMGLQACSHKTDESTSAADSATLSSSLEITSYGPKQTKAGVVFNRQPDGGSAIWIRMNQSLDGSDATIEFDGAALKGAVTDNLVTAAIPPGLYAKPGKVTIRVAARKGSLSRQSSTVEFTVE